MLDDLINELCEKLEFKCSQIEPDKYKVQITNDITVEIIKIENTLYFFSIIASAPEDKKEQIYTYVMKANLLGQGTGNSVIGMDKDEKFLTLSYQMAYEDNYTLFKDKLEDFVNYLQYWTEEIEKLKNEKSIF